MKEKIKEIKPISLKEDWYVTQRDKRHVQEMIIELDWH